MAAAVTVLRTLGARCQKERRLAVNAVTFDFTHGLRCSRPETLNPYLVATRNPKPLPVLPYDCLR